MTLLEMIKKYKKVKSELERRHLDYPPDHLSAQIETMECIIKDLRSIEEDINVRALQFKVLRLISRELDNSNFEDARNLAQTMHLLSLPE